MYKSSLIFSLKVWSVSIIASPVLYYAWTNNYSEAFAVENFFGFLALSFIYGLILSLPCYALFLFANFYVGFRKWSDLEKRIALGLLAALLIAALIYSLFGHDDKVFLASTIKLAICYILSAGCAIVFFRLPTKSAF
jgi:hypothetical protein